MDAGGAAPAASAPSPGQAAQSAQEGEGALRRLTRTHPLRPGRRFGCMAGARAAVPGGRRPDVQVHVGVTSARQGARRRLSRRAIAQVHSGALFRLGVCFSMVGCFPRRREEAPAHASQVSSGRREGHRTKLQAATSTSTSSASSSAVTRRVVSSRIAAPSRASSFTPFNATAPRAGTR